MSRQYSELFTVNKMEAASPQSLKHKPAQQEPYRDDPFDFPPLGTSTPVSSGSAAAKGATNEPISTNESTTVNEPTAEPNNAHRWTNVMGSTSSKDQSTSDQSTVENESTTGPASESTAKTSLAPEPTPPLTPEETKPSTNSQLIPSLTDYFRVCKITTMEGYGVLTWLSKIAGVITTAENDTITFQTRDFCDTKVEDLQQVLHVGYILKFSTRENIGPNKFTASYVSPVYGEMADIIFKYANEIDLDSYPDYNKFSKEVYKKDLEEQALLAIITIFEYLGFHRAGLNSISEGLNKIGNRKLYEYIGTSLQKRRAFLERRTHLLRYRSDGSIELQIPAIYEAVTRLSSYLLRRGGVTTIQSLYEHYLTIDNRLLGYIGQDPDSFMTFISSHPFVFAVYPNKTFVAACRNLPVIDFNPFANHHVVIPQQHEPRSMAAFNEEPIEFGYGYETGYESNQKPVRSANRMSPKIVINVASDDGDRISLEELKAEMKRLQLPIELEAQVEVKAKRLSVCTCSCNCGEHDKSTAGDLWSSDEAILQIQQPTVDHNVHTLFDRMDQYFQRDEIVRSSFDSLFRGE